MEMKILYYTAITATHKYRDNDYAACDCCGEITRMNEMYQATIEDDEVTEGRAEATVCGSCLDNNKDGR